MSEVGSIESQEDIGLSPSGIYSRWIREIEIADQHEREWRQRARKVWKRYKDEREIGDTDNRFNILYANTEVLRGAMYARPPVPDVRRRFADKDPAGRMAAETMGRALSYNVDCGDLDTTIAAAVTDTLICGRGIIRVRYIPTVKDGIVTDESIGWEAVEWDMFRISPARRWQDVRWVAFGQLLTRAELKQQFPEVGASVKLDYTPKGVEESDPDADIYKRALVWEIWDKETRTVYAICRGYDSKPLAVRPDPLRLEYFFPIPAPMYSMPTGSTIPIPEYCQYQDQAEELDIITRRITALTDALRRRGVYDASVPELRDLATADDNHFIPVDSYAALAEKGGLAGVVAEMDITAIAKTINHLMAQRDAIKATIYEVTGISDVMRSATKATETLGAQQLKAQYGNSRLAPRQRQVQMHVRDVIRIAAEIIAEHFSPNTLSMIVGAQIAPEVLALMRTDKLREFRIDVETDSTIQPDAGEEQRNRVEMLTAMTAFAEKAIPAVQSGMIPAEIAKEMVLFGLRAFKASPQIETLIDTATQGAAGGDDQARAMQLQAREQELMQREQMAAQALAEREQQMQAAAQQLQEREQQIAAAEQRLTAGAQQLQAHESATRNEMGRRQQEISAASMQAQEARITAMVESFMARIASGAAANVDEKAACEAAERQAALASDEARAARSEELMRAMLATHQESMAQIAQLMKIVAAPKRAIRDNAGKLIGVAPAVNDA